MTKFAVLLLACAVLLSPVLTRAQTFEVASVKPADPAARGSMTNFRNDTLTVENFPVANLIMMAYSIQPFQLEGGPAWARNERFNVTAKLPAGDVKANDPKRNDEMRTALRALLADRFQLTVHRETKMMPAYVLVVAKNGFKLKEIAEDARLGNISMGFGKLKTEGTSIDDLAHTLSGNLGSPVVDQTGIKGLFNVALEWTPDDVQAGGRPAGESSEPAAGPSIFTALQEQLGLRLDKQKAPVEMLVIDRVERPTAN